MKKFMVIGLALVSILMIVFSVIGINSKLAEATENRVDRCEERVEVIKDCEESISNFATSLYETMYSSEFASQYEHMCEEWYKTIYGMSY